MQVAERLVEASQEIDKFEDTRTLSLLRRIVREKGLAERMKKEGKCISLDGDKIVTEEEFDEEYRAWEAMRDGKPETPEVAAEPAVAA